MAKQSEQVQEIPISELFPFKDHPFRVLDDDMRIRGSFDEQQLKSCISDAGCADSTAGELVRTQSNEGCNAGKAKAFTAVKEDCC